MKTTITPSYTTSFDITIEDQVVTIPLHYYEHLKEQEELKNKYSIWRRPFVRNWMHIKCPEVTALDLTDSVMDEIQAFYLKFTDKDTK